MPVPTQTCAKILLGAAAALLTGCAQASWTGQGELGLVMARGNANTESANLKLNLTSDLGRWKNSGMARVLYGRSNDIQSAERWEMLWQTEFRLHGQPFIFGSVRHEEDEFGGFSYQSTASTGLGYNFIDTTTTRLSASLGAGYRKLQGQLIVRDPSGEVIERIEGQTSEDAMGKAGLNYRQRLTNNNTLINNFLVETGTNNTMATNDLSLQLAMTRKLALGVGYSVRHNAQPPEGLKETDQLTTVNLVYKLE